MIKPFFSLILYCSFCFPSPGMAEANRSISDSGPIPAAERAESASSGADILGEDVLWRPRESLIFFLHNADGSALELDFAVRDMETYHQGQRPVSLWVLDPTGEVVAEKWINPTRNPSGNEKFRDGIYDMGQDFRYRAWHRAFSPDGVPPGRTRHPYLDHPEKLTPRHYRFEVPAGAPGTYRFVVLASWDHWISLSANRDLPAAIHPGNGPLYLPPGRLEDGAYLYVPEQTLEIGLGISEEVEPFNWSLQLKDPDGGTVAETEPRKFFNFDVLEPEQPGGVYELTATGESTGACLHLAGVPAILAPDPGTARLFKDAVRVDDRGRLVAHSFQATLHAWQDSLTPDDLAVDTDIDPAEIEDAKIRELVTETIAILDGQKPNPHDESYEKLAARGYRESTTLAQAVATAHPENPFHGDAAIIRRIALGQIAAHQNFQPHFSWKNNANDFPARFDLPPRSPFAGTFRSNYLNFEPGGKRTVKNVLLPIQEHLDATLPTEVAAALRQPFLLWTRARAVEEMGESSNKWAMNIAFRQSILEFTTDPEERARLATDIDRQLDRLLVPGAAGRSNPDPTPHRSSVGHTFAGPADAGMTGGGYAAEQWGFDAGYSDNTERYLNELYHAHPEDPRIRRYFKNLYDLTSHLSLPVDGVPPGRIRGDIVSPTDMFSRLEQHTNRSYLPEGLRDEIPYGDLWQDHAGETRRPWPALSEEPFTKVIDNQFYFIRTPAYYAIHYSGPTSPVWRTFTAAEIDQGSADLTGYGDGMRGLKQRKSNKPGGLSAVYVPGVGPTLLGINQDVPYANNVWGRLNEPVTENHEGDMDPALIASGFVDTHTTFDPDGGVLLQHGEFQHAPLAFSRRLTFADDHIDVLLDITALAPVNLRELRESFPFYANDRTLRAFDAGGRETAAFDARQGGPETLDLKAFQIVDENGGGATIVFEESMRAATTERADRSGRLPVDVRSLQVALPHDLEAGERVQFRYRVVPHRTSLDVKTLME